MFSSEYKRYMTRAIADSLPMEVQKVLWDLINQQREQGKELDYLQVFELKNLQKNQHIIYRQEVPDRKQEWLIALKHALPVNNTVWCIDDDAYQTMLFPNDY